MAGEINPYDYLLPIAQQASALGAPGPAAPPSAQGIALDPAILAHLGANLPPSPAPEPTPGAAPQSITDTQSVLDMLHPPSPAAPTQTRPDYVVPAPNVPSTPGGVAKSNAAYDQRQKQAAQQAYASGQRMPTIADINNERTSAEGQDLGANAMATQAAAAQANDTYAINKQTEDDLRASNDQLKRMQDESAKIRTNKEQAVQAVMQEVDGYKVDHNRYWSDASTGKKVGWIVAMALSGLGDALQHKSGPNPVIGMLETTIDKDVRAQLDQRDQLKEKLGRANAEVDKWDRFSSNRDAQFLAQRAQAKELVAQQLTTAATKYGSDLAVANGAKAAADIRKSAAKDAAQAVDMAHNFEVQDKQLAISRQQVGIAGGHLKLARDQFDWQKNKDQQQLDLDAAKLAQKGDPKATEAYQKFGVAGVTNKDGTPFIAQGTPEGVERLREKKAASTTIVGLLDAARRIRTGWTSDTAKSKEWQELQQIWSTAKAKGKDALGLGALSGDDYKILDGYLGTSDPTKYIDPSAGIERARKTVIADLNESLKAHGMDGDYDIPDIVGNGGPQEQPSDAETKDVLEATFAHAPYERSFRELGVDPTGKGSSDYTAELRRSYDANGGMFPSQKQVLDMWSTGLRSTDPKVRAMASENLNAAANGAQASGVKAYAQQLLTNSVAGDLDSPDESTDPNAGRAVARDTIAEPRYPNAGTKR